MWVPFKPRTQHYTSWTKLGWMKPDLNTTNHPSGAKWICFIHNKKTKTLSLSLSETPEGKPQVEARARVVPFCGKRPTAVDSVGVAFAIP